ncbi:hypothetical protein E2C01_038194 [Portunus trituberculatus]|uniref:Uncharacterized protein n=1 Tax=Portunus trituberculatus TaxID=210409 RepID=A0A5B7FBK5_PORTR|nr:hypothetical protein [Portunus trituberculatus]
MTPGPSKASGEEQKGTSNIHKFSVGVTATHRLGRDEAAAQQGHGECGLFLCAQRDDTRHGSAMESYKCEHERHHAIRVRAFKW